MNVRTSANRVFDRLLHDVGDIVHHKCEFFCSLKVIHYALENESKQMIKEASTGSGSLMHELPPPKGVLSQEVPIKLNKFYIFLGRKFQLFNASFRNVKQRSDFITFKLKSLKHAKDSEKLKIKTIRRFRKNQYQISRFERLVWH